MPFSPEFLLPHIPVLEKVVRALLIYLFLLVAFRIFGKRQLGQLTPFDLVVLLIISNIVQNAMIGDDTSLGGGLIGATTILVANFALAYLTFHFPRIDRLVQGEPTMLIQNGKILYDNLKKELVTEDDLRRALRRNEIELETDLPSLKRVDLDEDGQITIIRKGRMTRAKDGEKER